VHEHFDATGKVRTGITVVHRESLWDEQSRGRALRLAEYEATICKCGCGLPIDVAHDPKQGFSIDRIVCRAGKAIAKVRRADEAQAKAAQRPEGWDDGLHYSATPVTDERGKRGD
jgi:hypothetical protein